MTEGKAGNTKYKEESNSLGVETVGIFSTEEFIRQFLGKSLVLWVDNTRTYFGLINFSRLDIYPGDPPMAIFRSEKDSVFGISVDNGFGFKVIGESKHYWIDKMNSKEMVVITYLGEHTNHVNEKIEIG